MNYKKSYKKKNNNRKRKTHKKRSYKKRRYQKGGGCGCSGKISGGSSGPSNLSQLSPNHYNQYYNVEADPTNAMVSTSVPSNVITGGSNVITGGKGKRNRTKKMMGGISGVDMVGSLGNASTVNNVTNYLTGSDYTNNPGFLNNILSVQQPTTILPNTPYVPPGISVLV
jgi:hypothetical protein